MNVDNNTLVMFHDGSFELDVRVSASENTVWLTLDQIAFLFEKDKSTVSRHIKNIFSEGELDRGQLLQIMQLLPLMVRHIMLITTISTLSFL